MLFSPVFAQLQYRLDPQVTPLARPWFPVQPAQPLCFQTPAHSCSPTANVHLLSFLSLPHSFHRDGGVCPASPNLEPNSRRPPLAPTLKCFLFTLLRTLLHFLAVFCNSAKVIPFSFRHLRTLSTKTLGVGVLLSIKKPSKASPRLYSPLRRIPWKSPKVFCSSSPPCFPSSILSVAAPCFSP